MATLNGPQQSLTTQDVDAWLLAAQERLAHLHLQVARPGQTFLQRDAWINLCVLLEEAFEEVRVVSASAREESQELREKAAHLREHSARLQERGAAVMARRAPAAPPPPEEVQQAESRLLEMFRGRPKQEPR